MFKVIGLLIFVLFSFLLFGSESSYEKGKVYRIELADGSVIFAQIVEDSEQEIKLESDLGLIATVKKESITQVKLKSHFEKSVKDKAEKEQKANTKTKAKTNKDPSQARLLVGPSGRGVAQGDIVFSDHMVLFPGFSFGFTDNFGLNIGGSIIPGIDLDYQLFYLYPQVYFNPTDKIRVSAGMFFGHVGEAEAMFIDTGISFGDDSHYFSFGLGIGDGEEDFDGFGDFDFDILSITFSYYKRIKKHIAIISENRFFWTMDEGDASVFLPNIGVRFLGSNLSGDFAIIMPIVAGETIDQGIPVFPWLSLTYKFR